MLDESTITRLAYSCVSLLSAEDDPDEIDHLKTIIRFNDERFSKNEIYNEVAEPTKAALIRLAFLHDNLVLRDDEIDRLTQGFVKSDDLLMYREGDDFIDLDEIAHQLNEGQWLHDKPTY